MILRQKIYLAVIIIANALAWGIPNNVVHLVAKERQTILGRYSREHFSANAAILAVSLIGLYIDQARTPRTYKRRWFQVVAILIVLIPVLLIGDFALRLGQPKHYVIDKMAYRRPPNIAWSGTVEDRPITVLTYPNAPAGIPAFPYTMRTDGQGFRNRDVPEHADIVTLGDSFVEGSRVSDEHPWPVRFAQLRGLTVYNLGMSGYSPIRHLAALKKYGPSLKPKYVICMLYEGNDFRSIETVDEDTGYGLGKLLKVYFKQSPILASLDNLIINTLGGVGDSRQIKGMEVLSWLPLRIPDADAGGFYSFVPKQLTEGYMNEEKFSGDLRWVALESILKEMKATSQKLGCELIIAYAPTKAHVVMPLAFARLPADKVYAFARIGTKKLPDAKTFTANLLPYLDTREAVVKRWCEQRDIRFFSVTEALRQAAAQGEQVYFVYDQHWSPLGHAVVARAMADYWMRNHLGQERSAAAEPQKGSSHE